MDVKNIFALNLNKYMKLKGKSRNDISTALGVSYFTVSDWVNGKKYPRMDKVEMLANFFGIQKSDLIEKRESISETETLSASEKEWLDLFRSVPTKSQPLLIETFRTFNKIPEDRQEEALELLEVALRMQKKSE
jgi:transcriptional regulator with XRE-family HTH domain